MDEKPDQAEVTAPARHAAYDTTYLRFVGGTHETKAKAREAAKAAGVESFEIREV